MIPSLELGPILRSMRHHKGAFSLLVLEVERQQVVQPLAAPLPEALRL